jgi:hypothetical protein
MYIKKIDFERTGGFAGIRLRAELDMDDLPADQKHEILEILDETDFDKLPEKLSGKMPMPDEFVYCITINSDEEDEHQVLAGESSLPGDLQTLIEILERIAKTQMRKGAE